MHIPVNKDAYLSEIRASDKPAYLKHLSERVMYDTLLSVPHPYTEADADCWLAKVAEAAAKGGPTLLFAIREPGGALIGGCAFSDFGVGARAHRTEIGYWLARPYWGRGIMTAVVRKLCEMAANEFGLIKLTAHVFADNAASARVLEKCGFVQEGFLEKHLQKDGRLIDIRLYGLILRPS